MFGFFLGWQNELEEVLFESCEVGRRVTTKAIAMHALLTTALQVVPQCLPFGEVIRGKFLACAGTQPRGCACRHADHAAQHEGR